MHLDDQDPLPAILFLIRVLDDVQKITGRDVVMTSSKDILRSALRASFLRLSQANGDIPYSD
jgi:hypothetical protein